MAADMSGRKGRQIRIVVINLDRSTDRLAFQTRQFAEMGLTFTRLKATDAGMLTQRQRQIYADKYFRPLTETEIACLVSHIRVWESAVETGETALIVEDDAILSSILPFVLDDLVEIAQDSVVNLETRGSPKLLSRKIMATMADGRVNLHRLIADHSGAAAYVVSPRMARFLLSQVERRASPTDLFMTNLLGLARLQCDPGLAVPMDYIDRFGVAIPAASASNIIVPKRNLAYQMNLLFFKPIYKIRRMAAALQMTVHKLKAVSSAVSRTVSACPTILERTNRLEAI